MLCFSYAKMLNTNTELNLELLTEVYSVHRHSFYLLVRHF